MNAYYTCIYTVKYLFKRTQEIKRFIKQCWHYGIWMLKHCPIHSVDWFFPCAEINYAGKLQFYGNVFLFVPVEPYKREP